MLFEITNSRAAVYEPLSGRNDGLEALTAAARGALYVVSGTGSQLFANSLHIGGFDVVAAHFSR